MTQLERFEVKYIPEPNSGCWLWTAGCNSNGYGQFRFGRQMEPANRVSWRLYRGPIPDGLHVLHRCDNPLCVNPDHLFLGTHQDNVDDMMAKGRGRRGVFVGEAHPRAKLTEREVIAIRADRRPQIEIGRSYGVSKYVIYDIKHRRCWRHI